jgi:hypothetical protein
METFLEMLREILKGIMREIGAYYFRKNVLENKKTTPSQAKGWSSEITNIDNNHPDGEVAGRRAVFIYSNIRTQSYPVL